MTSFPQYKMHQPIQIASQEKKNPKLESTRNNNRTLFKTTEIAKVFIMQDLSLSSVPYLNERFLFSFPYLKDICFPQIKLKQIICKTLMVWNIAGLLLVLRYISISTWRKKFRPDQQNNIALPLKKDTVLGKIWMYLMSMHHQPWTCMSYNIHDDDACNTN